MEQNTLGGGDQGADRVEHPAEHRELPGQAGGDEVRPVDVVGERAIRATRTGVVHLVRVGGTEVHPSCWVAWCGWRFATGLHENCSVHKITCMRGCRQMAIQAGLVQAGQELGQRGNRPESGRQPRQ